jgi:hypothetical protein
MPRPTVTDKPKPKKEEVNTTPPYYPRKLGFRKIDDEKYYRAYTYVSSHKVMGWQDKQEGVQKFFGNSKKPLHIGTAIHALMLEPPKVAEAICSDRDRCGELNTKDWEMIYMCVDSLRANQEIMEMLNPCKTELGMFYKGRGLSLRGKADALNQKERLIADVKTCSNLKKFESTIIPYNYHVQAAFYLTLAGAVEYQYGKTTDTLMPYKDFYWMVVDKKNGATELIRCPDECIEQGNEIIRNYFKHLKCNWLV